MEVQTWAPSFADVACIAESMTISRETESTRPEASFRAEWDKQVKAHQLQYPGGTLPSELRSLSYFWERKRKYLQFEQQQQLRCLFCGQLA